MRMKNILLISAMFITLSACATQPKNQNDVQEVVEEKPIIFAAPEKPPEVIVEQAPVIDLAPAAPTIDPNAPVPGSAADFAYQTGGEPRVFFGYDQYDLSSQARSVLKSQADWLNTYNAATVIIEGNADERGTREYNLALAARRAESVKSYLVAQGVTPSRLTTVSYGKERPIDARSDEAGWARNRNSHTNVSVGTVG